VAQSRDLVVGVRRPNKSNEQRLGQDTAANARHPQRGFLLMRPPNSDALCSAGTDVIPHRSISCGHARINGAEPDVFGEDVQPAESSMTHVMTKL
jgi:hypothetical protein